MATSALPQSTNGEHVNGVQPRKRVAIVGGGVAGLSAAWALNEHSDHEVVVFEANDYIGGHTHTVIFSKDGKSTPVDSGFIVCANQCWSKYKRLMIKVANTATYPNLLAFFKLKGVEMNDSEMSFSASRDGGAFEWSGSGLGAAFAQSSNITKPDIYVMLYDVFRFNQYSTDILDQDVGRADRDLTIGQYLEKYSYSQSFRDNYLIPMTACIWSTSPDKVSLDFPALTLIRFLYNHHLLQIVNRPPWLTVKDGAITYIKAITDKMPLGSVRPNCPVREVYRAGGKVYVKYHDQEEVFDHIIFACHADTTLQILASEATKEERQILSNFNFNQNKAILHSDVSLMPLRRAAWTSWNFITKSSAKSKNINSVCLTYWMNNLQHISEEEFGPVLVTLNPLFRPKEDTIQGEYDYSHPAFTPAAVAAQNELHRIQNHNSTSFAGAWTKYGFHEDGFSSGLAVAVQHLGAKIPFQFVDATFIRGETRQVTLLDRLARMWFWSASQLFAVVGQLLGSESKVKTH